MREENNVERFRVNETKCKGSVKSKKKERIARLFAVNCNEFGPRSSVKTDQLTEGIIKINVDGVMISSADARWSTHD